MTVLESFFHNVKKASLYKTSPMYVMDQEPFINSAFLGFFPGQEDIESARRLLALINDIESRFGRDRERERRWGERYLDIDILLFGSLIINEEDLVIPHQRLRERAFALEPLLEIYPSAMEPGTHVPYSDFLSILSGQV